MAVKDPLADVGATPSTLTGTDAAETIGGGGRMAVPLRVTLAFTSESLLTDSIADWLPAEIGANMMLTEQEAPGAMGAVQLSDSVNVAAEAPTIDRLLILSVALPVLEILTVWAGETVVNT